MSTFRMFAELNGEDVILTDTDLREKIDELDDSEDIGHGEGLLSNRVPVSFYLWGEGELLVFEMRVKKEQLAGSVSLGEFENFLLSNGISLSLPEGWKPAEAMENAGDYVMQYCHIQDDNF